MKVKLLFVIGNTAFGGGERGFAQIINGLPAEKYEVFLVSQPGKELYSSIHNPKVHFIPLTFSKLINPALISRLSGIIKHNNINIVHGQGARAEFYARLANKLAGRSYYLSTIQMPVEGFDVIYPKKLIYILLDRMSERFVDRFIVVSQALKEQLNKKHGISMEKISVVYNGVELDTFNGRSKERSDLRKELAIPPDSPLVGAIGRMVWQKGFEYFIEAMPEIVQIHPKTMFLLTGDGPLLPHLKDFVRKLKLNDRVIFTGFRSDILDLLSAIDILVLPSILEGFPMISLEAMAMAKPIVTTQIDGIIEQIVDGEEGILIPPRNSKFIAAGVSRLINDRELSSKLAAAARLKVESHFSVEKMVRETEEVYLSLVKANNYKQSDCHGARLKH